MSKESKLALKEIREAIKNKQNNEAIEKCKELLSAEPKNYMGLVLMGAAYQEKDKTEAAKYLKRAVEAAEGADPTIALQGLANCAETADLPQIYKRLLKLVPAKFGDYHEKLVNLTSAKNFNEICDILHAEIDLENNSDNSSRIESGLLSLGKIFTIQKQFYENCDKKCIVPALQKVSQSECDPTTKKDCCKLYFKQLYKESMFEELLKSASIIVEQFPSETNAFEWICQTYSTQYKTIDCNSLTGQPIEYFADKVLLLNPGSQLAFLVKAIVQYNKEQYVQARDLLVQIQGNVNNSKELLISCNMQIGAYGLAENIYRSLNSNSMEFGICLCHSDDPKAITDGIKILEQHFDSESALMAQGRAYQTLKEDEKLKETYQKLEALNNAEASRFFQIDFILSPEKGIEMLADTEPSTFEVELRKGKLYLDLKDYDNSTAALLKATKMKPYFADCFRYLGLLYNSINDIVRAKKCFAKCLNLNPSDEIALKYLCAIYRENKELDLNATLLAKIIEQLQGRQLKYALFQQGLNFNDMEEYNQGIESLRKAIRCDIKNMLYWEVLADAYNERGSYLSALKVYQKILDENPAHTYAKLQVANIKTTMLAFKESIALFEEILADQTDYLPALKGIAEAYYHLANSLLQQRRLGGSKENLQTALDYLQRIFLSDQQKNFVWLWRLTANILTQVASFPTKLCSLKINGKLVKEGSTEETTLHREELFDLALKFYTYALRLNQSDGILLNELALCAYYNITYNEKSNKQKMIELARNACKSSITNTPYRWQTWNLLGVLHATKADGIEQDNALAQHYFIKALQLENDSAVAWANLGVLYLSVSEIKLANEAFKRAQESDPTYINGWIGQAMIAETIGEKEEAMDLFRHCTQLEFNKEAALGYAHWVCTVLSDEKLLQQKQFQFAINTLHAIPYACDSISWYIAAEDDKACIESLCFYGYLFANQNLWSPAIKMYQLAVDKATSPEQKDVVHFNLGICYLNSEQYNLAIKHFSSLAEATLKSTIGLALSFRQKRDFEKSYETYEMALKWLATEDDEAKILLASSSIVYSYQGEEDTKAILFQCLAHQNRPKEALFSACALGIIHSDFQLVESVLDELKPHEDDVEYCHHVAFLTSQYYYARKQSKAAYYYLISRVHAYPDRVELRKVLAEFLISYFSKTNKYSRGTCQMAQSVITLSHYSGKKSDSLEAAKALLTASEAMKNVDKEKQKKLIQKSIHTHPTYKMAWRALGSLKA